MAGILGEIAAAKSLAEDVYDFARRAKNSGADIKDLDLKLRNDELLLRRFAVVLNERAALLQETEIDHLQLYLRAIARELKNCIKQIKTNQSKGKFGRVLWCLVGQEILEKEKKVGEWIFGLTTWLSVVDAMGKRADGLNRMIHSPAFAMQPWKINGLLDQGSSAKLWACSVRADYDVRPRATEYAVKQFHTEAWASYERERNAMHTLSRFPHTHIVSLINSYENNGQRLLIYPLAQGDLRSLLTNIQPEPGNHTERWLLTQMSGLAAAISFLHGAPGQTERARGYHHDVKPENILVFNRDGYTELKLGDFGFSTFEIQESEPTYDTVSTATVHTAKTSSPVKHGTDLYSPPETSNKVSERELSAVDMWALGCVFLEMLAWYFKPPGYTPLAFHRSRVQTIKDVEVRADSDSRTSARFWTLTSTGRPILHKTAKHLLETLKQLATCSVWLLDIVFHVERLLVISDKSRMTAAELNTVLKHSLELKKLAFGEDSAKFVVLNGRPLPKVENFVGTIITSEQHNESIEGEDHRAISTHTFEPSEILEIRETADTPTLKRYMADRQHDIRKRYVEDQKVLSTRMKPR